MVLGETPGAESTQAMIWDTDGDYVETAGCRRSLKTFGLGTLSSFGLSSYEIEDRGVNIFLFTFRSLVYHSSPVQGNRYMGQEFLQTAFAIRDADSVCQRRCCLKTSLIYDIFNLPIRPLLMHQAWKNHGHWSSVLAFLALLRAESVPFLWIWSGLIPVID